MKRRDFVKLSAMAAGAAVGEAHGAPLRSPQQAPQPAVKTVLLVTKCHLDGGFSLTRPR